MLSKFVLAAGLLAGVVAAQSNATNITIDPASIEDTTKASWCNGEENVCNTLCDSNPKENTCTISDLAYNCACQNGSAPYLQAYTTSMFSFVCQQAYANCIAAAPDDALAQDDCKTSILSQCGTQDITNYTAPASSSTPTATSSSASATASASTTGSATAASATASSTGAASALFVGRDYGVGILAAGVVAAFGFML